MRIYFDTCSLNRPLDDRSQLRVALEAEAILGILAECEAGAIDLVSSDILGFETDQNPNPQKKAFVASILDLASVFFRMDSEIQKRAIELESRGFKGLDALHIASAESAEADYLCTCDDKFLSRSRHQTDLSLRMLTPLELVRELDL